MPEVYIARLDRTVDADLSHLSIHRLDQDRWSATVDLVPLNQRGPTYFSLTDQQMGGLIINELKGFGLDARISTFRSGSGWPEVEVSGRLGPILRFLARHEQYPWLAELNDQELLSLI